jgi:hypothetical protein
VESRRARQSRHAILPDAGQGRGPPAATLTGSTVRRGTGKGRSAAGSMQGLGCEVVAQWPMVASRSAVAPFPAEAGQRETILEGQQERCQLVASAMFA